MTSVKVKKPNVILLDFNEVLVRQSFGTTLSEYFKKQVKPFLEAKGTEDAQLKSTIKGLMVQAEADVEFATHLTNNAQPSEKENVNMLCEYIDLCLNNNKSPREMIDLRYIVWLDGLQKKRLQTPVYSDSFETLVQWRYQRGIRLFVVPSDGQHANAMKWFITNTCRGNLTELFENIFDETTAGGPFTSADTFKQLLTLTGEAPLNILLITSSSAVAKAAKEGGIDVIVSVNSSSKAKAAKEALGSCPLPIVRTLKGIELMQ